MTTIFSMIKADFIKMKNTSFYWIHICIPIIGIVMFLWYYSFSKWNVINKVTGYFQAVSIVFPILISIVSSTAIEQEAMAGGFKEMIGVECKQKSLVSKIVMLLFSGFVATTIAIGGFSLGFEYILGQNWLSANFYINIILIIFGSQIFLYLFHIWISFLWGKEASIGIGVFESLFSALIITGLGEGLWPFVPCGWSIRFCQYFSTKWYNVEVNKMFIFDFNMGVINSICFTVCIALILTIWFNFYEGKKEM